jgi:hypothetical protein
MRGADDAEGEEIGWPAREARVERAYEALPQTPPGGKPPETQAPFPWTLDYTERQRFVKGSQAAHKPRALDKAPPLRRVRCEEGKGASVLAAIACLPLVGGGICFRLRACGALRAHEALPHAPPGGKPPETPNCA